MPRNFFQQLWFGVQANTADRRKLGSGWMLDP
jgi:hypothetical protein